MKKHKLVLIFGSVGLLAVVAGLITVLVGVLNGWFDEKKIVLSNEFLCQGEAESGFIEIDAEQYEKLKEDQKSFLLYIDDGTNEKLGEYLRYYKSSELKKVYRILAEEMVETDLAAEMSLMAGANSATGADSATEVGSAAEVENSGGEIELPTVVVFSEGEMADYLRSGEYDSYGAFLKWIFGLVK